MPCGLLGNSEMRSQFIAADAVLATGKEPNGHHPLVHAERRIFEDGSDLDGELLFAAFAEPHVPGGDVGVLIVAATRAGDTIRPAEPLQQRPRLGLIAEVLRQLREVQFHTLSLHGTPWCVK